MGTLNVTKRKLVKSRTHDIYEVASLKSRFPAPVPDLM